MLKSQQLKLPNDFDLLLVWFLIQLLATSATIDSGAEFARNQVTATGGALLLLLAFATMQGGVDVVNNTAGQDGGGMAALASTQLTLTDVSIARNYAAVRRSLRSVNQG